MAEKVVLVDTSVLIDLFRKTEKDNSLLIWLVRQEYTYCISAVTEYEIYTGAVRGQVDFWNELLERIQALPFDDRVAKFAVEINQQLKKKRKLIETADLFIAATAMASGLPLATLNKKHFERISDLQLIDRV